MALKHLDNYNFWDDTDPGQPGTCTQTSSTTIVADHLSLNGNGAQTIISDNLTAQGTYVINRRFSLSGFPILASASSAPIQLVTTGLGPQCGLAIFGTGKLQFYRGDHAGAITLIGLPSTIALTAGQMYDIEAKFVIGNAGSIELRVNGGVEIGPSVVDNQENAVSTADSVYTRNGNNGITTLFEHDIIMDGSGANLNGNFLGPVDVVLLPPTGSGFYSGWGFSGAASDWQAVQTADGDTSYINAAVVGTKTTFTQPGLPAGSTAVLATGVWVNMREDDAVTRGYKVLMRDPSGPTDALGATEFFAGPDYIYKFQPFEVSPFSGVQWTVPEINQPVEFGVQVTT